MIEKAKEYDINSNNDFSIDVDNLWLHIETNHHVKILLGVIYRHAKGNTLLYNKNLQQP